LLQKCWSRLCHALRSLIVVSEEQARELLGSSLSHTTLPWQGLDVWEYRVGDVAMPYALWVELSADGIVRKVIKMVDEPDRDSSHFRGLGHGHR